MRIEKFIFEISTENAAFEENKSAAIAEILEHVADVIRTDGPEWIAQGAGGMLVRDTNGNTCGRARLIVGSV